MEGKKNTRSGPISGKQKELLVVYMQQHPELNNGIFSNTFTHKQARKLWGEISSILNASPNGAKKEWEQWRKAWQDLKKNTKGKASTISNSMKKTGGGEASQETLDVLEGEIVQIMTPTIIDGHVDVPESCVMFEGISNSIDFCQKQEGKIEGKGKKPQTVVPSTSADMDHTYHLTEVDTDDNDHITSVSTGVITTPAKTPNKQRWSKSEKLQTSIGVSQRLVGISEQNERCTREYYLAKLDIMRAAEGRRQKYEHDKLLLLQQQINTQVLLLQEVRELKDSVMSLGNK